LIVLGKLITDFKKTLHKTGCRNEFSTEFSEKLFNICTNKALMVIQDDASKLVDCRHEASGRCYLFTVSDFMV
jgi:seryl-tRNA(Sec) selenium transferase